MKQGHLTIAEGAVTSGKQFRIVLKQTLIYDVDVVAVDADDAREYVLDHPELWNEDIDASRIRVERIIHKGEGV